MRILVCIKRVPAPGARINVTADGEAVDTANLLSEVQLPTWGITLQQVNLGYLNYPVPQDFKLDDIRMTFAEDVDCIAQKFFATRTDQELADFFARPELTEPEQVEFARLGDECGVKAAGAAPPTT